MTENEFFQLEIGKDIYFVIYDTDQMGMAFKGKKHRVYGAKQIDCNTNFVRISINNYQFWNVEGKIK